MTGIKRRAEEEADAAAAARNRDAEPAPREVDSGKAAAVDSGRALVSSALKALDKERAAAVKHEQAEDFMAAKKFRGGRPGYVFKMGKKGLGYYKDTPPTPAVTLKAAKKRKI